MDKKWLDQIESCSNCDACLEVCPTYTTTGNLLYSPKSRVELARKVLEGNETDEDIITAFYNCPKCMACESVCPQGIEISKIVAEARNRIVELGKGPLPAHKKVIQNLLEKGNTVNGDPGKRLDWLPEAFEPRRSEALFYAGCLPSYLVKDAAKYSYLALKKLNVDFTIIEDEGCCGTYMFESGEIEQARDYFQKNVDRFKKLGIKQIIAPCNGCYKCFKYFYPEILGRTDFEVVHVIQRLYNELKHSPESLKKIDRTITYHDSCRLGREGYTEEPRQLLRWCGADVKELPGSRENTPCCGSGGGVRSAFKDLSFDIAKNLLLKADTEEVVTPCPFCTFNLGFTSKSLEPARKLTYITKIIYESLQ
jgi:heterodisulfide reductase subunit D